MEWQLVESDEAMQHMLAQASHSKVVIVDTEFMRRNTFYPEVALVQLCFESDDPLSEKAWLIDPLQINEPGPLAELFADPDVLKVLHSASEDLEVFQRWLGVLPQPLFDTQRAAGLVNLGFGMGYRALVQEICDVDLPKGETRSDWLQRPLTESQCEYAALDVTWLLPVWRELHARCEQQGKLPWVLADGRDATRVLGTEVYDFQKRIKSAWKLDRRQLGILTAVCNWREKTARVRDKPRGWIIDDPSCLRLALDDPQSLAELTDKADLPQQAVRRYGDELLNILAAQREVPDTELPPRLPPPLNAAQRDQIKRMKSQVQTIADKMSVSPQMLVSAKDYEMLLREAKGETFEPPVHWQGWRQQAVISPLRQVLAGQAK
ncbi:Ribonuclease D [Halioglobus japonicus]|nr:Ribonuclease D [Halioglobus japonicus]